MATNFMTNAGWAEDLIAREAVMFHSDSRAVGKAKKFYDGVTEFYVSKANGMNVFGEVLELDTGHALLVGDRSIAGPWFELSKAEARFYASLQEGFNGLIVVAAKNATANGVELDKGLMLLTCILRAQLAALEATP